MNARTIKAHEQVAAALLDATNALPWASTTDFDHNEENNIKFNVIAVDGTMLQVTVALTHEGDSYGITCSTCGETGDSHTPGCHA